MDRFLSKVEKTDTCWVWNAARNEFGYGYFFNKKMVRSHRFSYELHKGKIPEDKEIDHICKNRRCVNPEHLEAVTRRENIRRSDNFISKEMNVTHCPHGHEYNEENTYLNKNKRYCRICRYERNKIYGKVS